jgi:transcriptional/translational regulatory protein YebC/TACO1
VTVFTPNTHYFKARQALLDAFGELDFEVDEIQFIPQSTAPVPDEERDVLAKFLDMLDDLDDVQRVYHNVG